ncbi:hypothetical protein EMCRGX_G006964 [Ephydatia muelleri]
MLLQNYNASCGEQSIRHRIVCEVGYRCHGALQRRGCASHGAPQTEQFTIIGLTTTLITCTVATFSIIPVRYRSILRFLGFSVLHSPSDFTLCVRWDTGVMEPFRQEDVPLMVRLRLGPSEDIAKIFVLEVSEARPLEVTEETANWMKFSEAELNIFIKKFNEEEDKERKKASYVDEADLVLQHNGFLNCQ